MISSHIPLVPPQALELEVPQSLGRDGASHDASRRVTLTLCASWMAVLPDPLDGENHTIKFQKKENSDHRSYI